MPYDPRIRDAIKPLPEAFVDDFYDIAEVCALADLSLSGFRWVRANGRGPEAVVIGKRTAFPKESTRAWLNRRILSA